METKENWLISSRRDRYSSEKANSIINFSIREHQKVLLAVEPDKEPEVEESYYYPLSYFALCVQEID